MGLIDRAPIPKTPVRGPIFSLIPTESMAAKKKTAKKKTRKKKTAKMTV